jgi:hypothetical protein
MLKETNPNEKHLWATLLENGFTHNLKLRLNDLNGNGNLDLVSLLVQFKVSILVSKMKLVKPFIDLIQNPAGSKNSFLPTMQQDFTFDIQTAL